MNSKDQRFAATHEIVVDLIGAYVDDELPEQARSTVEKHLQSCTQCQREAQLQAAVSGELVELEAMSASKSLKRRIRAGLDESSSAELQRTSRPAAGQAPKRFAWIRPALPWMGWGIAAAQLAVIVLLNMGGADRQQIPMIESALADYHRTFAGELPAVMSVDLSAMRAELPFPVEPLPMESARFLGGWRTAIREEPAAALAYQVNNQIVIQYVISESLFFKQPEVQNRVARDGRYVTSDGSQTVLAWPGPESGNLLVAEMSSESLVELVL